MAQQQAVAGPVQGLTVVYDRDCPLCRRCRRWVLSQRSLVPFRFVAAQEPWVADWLGATLPVGDELVVVEQGGGAVWVGPDAFIVCLWGLESHRSLALRLQRRGASALAKRAFHLLSSGRGVASLFLGSGADPGLDLPDDGCGEACAPGRSPGRQWAANVSGDPARG